MSYLPDSNNPTNIVHAVLNKILQERGDVLLLACSQRAKFEGWLKFELAAAFSREAGIDAVGVEEMYLTGGRSDISLFTRAEKWLIEIKTANTNWRVDGVENLHRPISKNMTGIAEDILVLKQKRDQARGIAVFCIFPVPETLWKERPGELKYHLSRLEAQAHLDDGCLWKVMNYVPITSRYGVCTFVLEVTTIE